MPAKVGVDRLVQVGVDAASSAWGAALAARHPAVLATVALHPNEAPGLAAQNRDALDEAFREIEALAAQPRVRGIGETGIDTFRTAEDGRAAQEPSFRAHIAIAKRYGKPPRHRPDAGLPPRGPAGPRRRDRRFGYPVELLQKATAAGWRFSEHDVTYHPRAAGTRSKVSGSVKGTAAHRARLRKVVSR